MIVEYQVRCVVGAEPLSVSFRDEYELGDFLEQLDEDTEIHVLKVTRYKAGQVQKL